MKQERVRLIIQAAIQDHQSAEAYARFMAEKNPQQAIATKDLGHFVALYDGLIEHLGKSGKVKDRDWVAAYERAERLSSATVEHFQAKRAEQSLQAERPASGGFSA